MSEAVRTRLLASTSIVRDTITKETERAQHVEAEVEREEQSELKREGNEVKASARKTSSSDGISTDESELDDSETDSETELDESEDDSEAHSTRNSHGQHMTSNVSQDQPQHGSTIHDAQLSPDGTCVFTAGYDRKFSVYPIDTDILESQSPRSLAPYAQFSSSNPIWAFAANPYFSLHDAQSTQVLVSHVDQYINLYNAIYDVSGRSYKSPQTPPAPIDISTKLASYKLIDSLTEAVIAPSSLAYTICGTHFIAGSQNQIALFDLNYTDAPITKIRTIPSVRSKLKDGGRGYKGVVTSLSIAPSSKVLAAGTRTREIALYGGEGFGDQITHLSLPGSSHRKNTNNERMQRLTGNGVSQLKWSPCERYLYVAERESDALLIYDKRDFSFCLGHCIGRTADTKQKLGFDIWSNGGSQEIWAGGTDGKIRIWKDPHLQQGDVLPDEVLDVGDGPVSNTLVHPTGSLAVATRGGRSAVGLEGKGAVRGGGLMPRFREWGCVDILGLQSYGSVGADEVGSPDTVV